MRVGCNLHLPGLLWSWGKTSMKASHTILVSLLLAALMVIAAGAVATSSFRQIEQATEAHRHAAEVLNDADDLLSALKDAETSQRGYVLTGDESFLEPYLAVRDSIPVRLKTLRKISPISPSQKHLAALAPLIEAKMLHISRVIDLRRNQDMAAAQAGVTSGEGKRLMNSIRAEMHAFVEMERSTLLAQHPRRPAHDRRRPGADP